MPAERRAKRDGISAPKTPTPFMPVEEMSTKKPHLYRLLRFLLAQKQLICTKDVVTGMMQRQVHYPRWKKYLYMLRDMGYIEKKSTYWPGTRKVRWVHWWVQPEWKDKLKHLRQSPLWDRIKSEVKLNGTTGCWEWQGYCKGGRGVIGWDQNMYYVNYIAFRLFKELPSGTDLAIACGNDLCCNPKHQRVVPF